MAVFTIWSHTQLPICKAEVTKHVKLSKEWTLRYQLNNVSDSTGPLDLLDQKMGATRKAPGIYAAKFEAVKDAWQHVLDSAPAPEPEQEPGAIESASSHSKAKLVVAAVTVSIVCFGVLLRILCIPLYIGFAIVGGGAPSVMATIALIDGWLHFEWLQNMARNYIKGVK